MRDDLKVPASRQCSLDRAVYRLLGASAVMTVFDAQRLRSVTDEALAAYDYQVAAYRENVLTGFRQVEDNLAAVGRFEFPERPECCGKLVSSNFN
jgi:hypothetical protein